MGHHEYSLAVVDRVGGDTCNDGGLTRTGWKNNDGTFTVDPLLVHGLDGLELVWA